jgi:F0F1-type ATP synthase epsilon subunit
MKNDLLNLSVRNRDKVIYSGKVSSITSVNKKGKFDVLPRHANFISLIHDFVIIREPSGREQKIAVDNGVLRVEQDRIEVFFGIKK